MQHGAHVCNGVRLPADVHTLLREQRDSSSLWALPVEEESSVKMSMTLLAGIRI